MRRLNGLVLIIVGYLISISGFGQNLLQNPSFESATSWDEFWLISTMAPSSATAVVIENIADAHDGIKSAELSNTAFNKWTYLYSDSVNAPLSFSANKTYEISGWIKSVEEGKRVILSVFWNGGLNEMIIYNGNPDPVTNPDWFFINTTISPVADFSDGYLSFGFRADKAGPLATGILLLDDFSVTRMPDTDTDIVTFTLPEQTGPATIDTSVHTVLIEVPYGTDETALSPAIGLSDGASIVPVSGAIVDFSLPVTYTVTAEDGTTVQDWTVTVTKGLPSTQAEIVSFSMVEQTGPATIDNVVHTVILEVEYGTGLGSLVPTIGLSPGATINPGSGVVNDFSSPVIYTVTAEDGITMQTYIIALMLSPTSNETDVISFSMAEQVGPSTIDNLLHTITIDVFYGTDVTTLVPAIDVSTGATVVPVSGSVADFTATFIYTVTAEDGISSQAWTVSVTALPNTDTEILSFTLPEQIGPAGIDSALHSVTIEVPSGADVTALLPTIDLSPGATVDPVSGVINNFTAPTDYLVTAEDGISSQNWSVTVVSLQNTEADILTFTLPEQIGPSIIDYVLHVITIDVSYGSDVTALLPTINLSPGASVDPLSGVVNDFTAPIDYLVTAEDGISNQAWTVSVVLLLNTETNILSFTLPEPVTPAILDSLLHTVTIDVPYGTDVTALIPVIDISDGATVIPTSGLEADFSLPVVYRVTAADGSTFQDWEVSVVVLPNTETDILSLTLPEQVGLATIDSTLHTISIDVPYGTDPTALVPTIGTSVGATVFPVSGLATDFSVMVVYSVTAEDGITFQNWEVSVVVLPNTETDILSFVLAEETGPATIDRTQHSIAIEVVKESNVTALVPVINLSEGATINPASDAATDFTTAVTYIVTAEDGVISQDWTVTVYLDPAVKVETEKAKPSIFIYPNPATDEIVVEMWKSGDIYLIDLVGQVVRTVNNASTKTILPVAGLKRGIYFLRVKIDYSNQVSKVILE